MKTASTIWFNGHIVPWRDATVHVMSHGLNYGSAVFEGVRAYKTSAGPAIFRLKEHVARLLASAKIYRMPVPYSAAELVDACKSVVAANELESAYLRPIIYRGFSGFSLAAPADGPIEVAIAAVEFGAYLGEAGLSQGVDVCVSSWQRAAPNTYPTLAKASGHYLNNQLVAMEARRLGFMEGLALSVDGTVSEGAGENLFLIVGGELITPPPASSILKGITRDTVIALASDLHLPVRERAIAREELYLADEVFLTGTAAEITPVRSVDGIDIGCGARGPLTKALQERFFATVDGTLDDHRQWLDPVARRDGSREGASHALHGVYA